jgi:hypothetical protein
VGTKGNRRSNHGQQYRDPKAEPTGLYGAMVKQMSRTMLGDLAEPQAATARRHHATTPHAWCVFSGATVWTFCQPARGVDLGSVDHTAIRRR